MNFIKDIALIFFLFVVNSKSELFEEFYEYVKKEIENSQAYTPPTDNEAICSTNNESVKCIGNYDFIVVGGGSAGSIVASRLSEVFKWRVLLLEAGSNQTEFSDIPGMQGYVIRSSMNWGYLTTPQKRTCQGMINKQCFVHQGKALGGSAAVNTLLNARGIPADFDEWEALGNPGWSYKNVLPYFKKIEKVDFLHSDSFYRGQNGLIHCNFTGPGTLVSKIFSDANHQQGLLDLDSNSNGIHTISQAEFHIKNNKRDNSAHGYIDPNQNRKNLDIMLNAFVTQILIENNKAYGVEFIKEGQKHHVYANKEVILSAGAINTPQILLLSGVGPANEIKAKNIKVKIDLPAVGKHMKNHPMFINFIIRTDLKEPSYSLYKNLKRWMNGQTPLTNAGDLEQIAFIYTKNNSANLRNIEFQTFAPPFGIPADPVTAFNLEEKYAEEYRKYNSLTDLCVGVILLKLKSNGSVTLKSNNPKDFPLIDNNYFSDSNNEDIEDMYQAIKYLESLIKTPSFKSVNGRRVGKQVGCEDIKEHRAYWYCAIQKMTVTIYHPIGTTRMGNNTTNSVVNNDLQVHNISQLRIVDAGVMPEHISGHTNAVVYMIAEKISDKIKQYYL